MSNLVHAKMAFIKSDDFFWGAFYLFLLKTVTFVYSAKLNSSPSRTWLGAKEHASGVVVVVVVAGAKMWCAVVPTTLS